MSDSRRAPSLQAATIDAVKLEYYRYEVTYGLYMMTPIEKIVANLVIVVLLILILLLGFVGMQKLIAFAATRLLKY